MNKMNAKNRVTKQLVKMRTRLAYAFNQAQYAVCCDDEANHHYGTETSRLWQAKCFLSGWMYGLTAAASNFNESSIEDSKMENVENVVKKENDVESLYNKAPPGTMFICSHRDYWIKPRANDHVAEGLLINIFTGEAVHYSSRVSLKYTDGWNIMW